MPELSRTVRFCVAATGVSGSPGRNTFAASPAMDGLGAFYELVLRCQGEPDPQTGYLADITELDAAARSALIPIIQDAFRNSPADDPASLMPVLFHLFRQQVGESARSLSWRLTPYYCLDLDGADMTTVRLTQQFEFAAAHRLSVPELSEADNRRIFGKCSNRHGHGHNYRLDVTVAVPLPATDQPRRLTLAVLEELVYREVIERFDHTNLNLDCPEFADLNPSVEHITAVCFDRLAPHVQAAGGELDRITVWETSKTSCTVARES